MVGFYAAGFEAVGYLRCMGFSDSWYLRLGFFTVLLLTQLVFNVVGLTWLGFTHLVLMQSGFYYSAVYGWLSLQLGFSVWL